MPIHPESLIRNLRNNLNLNKDGLFITSFWCIGRKNHSSSICKSQESETNHNITSLDNNPSHLDHHIYWEEFFAVISGPKRSLLDRSTKLHLDALKTAGCNPKRNIEFLFNTLLHSTYSFDQ